MGRGGTDSLWSSGMTCCRAGVRASTANLEEVVSGDATRVKRWGCVVSGTTRDLSTCVSLPLEEDTPVIGSSLTGN